MKKTLLLLSLVFILFNCSDNSNNDSDNMFGEETQSNDIVKIVTDDETYIFEEYLYLEDEDIGYKSYSFYNYENNTSLSISIFYESENRETDWISINFSNDTKSTDLSSFFSYDNTVFQDDDPQNVSINIEEDSETNFKITFDGVFSSPKNSQTLEYNTLNINEGIIDIIL